MNNSKRILAAMLAGAMVLCAGCGKEEETEEETTTGTAVEDRRGAGRTRCQQH